MPIRPTLTIPQYKPQTPEKLVESKLNAGMFTDIDHASDIPNGALALAVNARVRTDRTERRVGYSLFTPAAPNANKVMLLTVFKHDDGASDILRFTPSTIHERGAGVWTLWATGTPLTGGVNDHFQAVVVLNNLVFTNGKDRLYKVNSVANTYDPIAAAPKAKYITGFFNRVIAANYLADGAVPANIAGVGWCADGNVDIWDPGVDPSAGFSPIVESTSDLGDGITGVFGGPSLLILLRELSVWVAIKQPIATDPFNFSSAIPGIGCNAPHTAVVIPSGLCWYDARTSALWAWAPGSVPEQISHGKVEREIASAVDDPNNMFASFSGAEFELTLGVPVPTSDIVRLWCYNFKTKAFSYDEQPLVSEVFDIETGPSRLAMDDLVGTIDDLRGTIDELVNIGASRTVHLLGRTDGLIYEEDENVDKDNGSAFTCIMESKDFDIPGEDSQVAQVLIEYICKSPGALTLKYSVDSGVTYKTAKSVNMGISRSALLTWNRAIKARRFRWRLESLNGQFSIIRYKIDIYPSGKSKQDDK